MSSAIQNEYPALRKIVPQMNSASTTIASAKMSTKTAAIGLGP